MAYDPSDDAMELWNGVWMYADSSDDIPVSKIRAALLRAYQAGMDAGFEKGYDVGTDVSDSP